jgi:hypothetical protein
MTSQITLPVDEVDRRVDRIVELLLTGSEPEHCQKLINALAAQVGLLRAARRILDGVENRASAASFDAALPQDAHRRQTHRSASPGHTAAT